MIISKGEVGFGRRVIRLGDGWRRRDEGVAAHAVAAGSGVLSEAEASQADLPGLARSARKVLVLLSIRDALLAFA